MSMPNFKLFALVLAIPLIFLGCSQDDDDFTDDPTCGRSIDVSDVTVKISPTGAGTVTKRETTVGDLFPQQAIVLFANPNEGYLFEYWAGDTEGMALDYENPKYIILCDLPRDLETITITSVFKEIEE